MVRLFFFFLQFFLNKKKNFIGQLDVASHFIEWSAELDPENHEIHKIRSQIYKTRVSQETSLMAKGIFTV